MLCRLSFLAKTLCHLTFPVNSIGADKRENRKHTLYSINLNLMSFQLITRLAHRHAIGADKRENQKQTVQLAESEPLLCY